MVSDRLLNELLADLAAELQLQLMQLQPSLQQPPPPLEPPQRLPPTPAAAPQPSPQSVPSPTDFPQEAEPAGQTPQVSQPPPLHLLPPPPAQLPLVTGQAAALTPSTPPISAQPPSPLAQPATPLPRTGRDAPSPPLPYLPSRLPSALNPPSLVREMRAAQEQRGGGKAITKAALAAALQRLVPSTDPAAPASTAPASAAAAAAAGRNARAWGSLVSAVINEVAARPAGSAGLRPLAVRKRMASATASATAFDGSQSQLASDTKAIEGAMAERARLLGADGLVVDPSTPLPDDVLLERELQNVEEIEALVATDREREEQALQSELSEAVLRRLLAELVDEMGRIYRPL